MVNEVEKGIYTFKIALPDNPLRWLNCYVIKGGPGQRNLLIDSGFHRQECLDDLLAGMKELELDPRDTDVFFTHAHSDHTGNGFELAELGCRLFMGETDYAVMRSGYVPERWDGMARVMGVPGRLCDVLINVNPANDLKPKPFKADFVDCGKDLLRYGGRELECILTPGHTPGHICLYDRADGLMFTGDNVLFDITPNITAWPELADPLGSYLECLEGLKHYEVRRAFPAHRTQGDKTMYQRICEIQKHHDFRLAEAASLVSEYPEGVNAWELAGRMTWKIHSKNWDDFPNTQKWFAVGESLSHLQHLQAQGILRCEDRGEQGQVFFSC